MNAQTRATADLMVLMMAMLSGIAIVILAVMIGGGPGWSVLRLSAAAIVLTPAGALTWCYRDQRVMPAIAKGVLAAFVVLDTVIAVGIFRQIGHATETFDSINPAAALIWGTLWLFWQVLTLLAAMKRQPVR
jgi:hypothetical protein